MRHKTPKTSSIEKALAILMAFTHHHNHEMGTLELSQKLGFHSATVSRILQILRKKGFLRHNGKTRKFTLGPATFELGKTIFRSVSGNLLNLAIPYLVDLREEVGETVILETISGDSIIVTYIAQGKRSMSVALNIGDRVPIQGSPGAKSIIAFSDQKTIDRLLDKKMHPLTSHTITDKETLELQLKQIRDQGVAFGQEEISVGINAIGVPIFDHDNRPVAAVVIAGLTSRVKCDTKSSMVVALKKTARDISAQLFHGKSMADTHGKQT